MKLPFGVPRILYQLNLVDGAIIQRTARHLYQLDLLDKTCLWCIVRPHYLILADEAAFKRTPLSTKSS